MPLERQYQPVGDCCGINDVDKCHVYLSILPSAAVRPDAAFMWCWYLSNQTSWQVAWVTRPVSSSQRKTLSWKDRFGQAGTAASAIARPWKRNTRPSSSQASIVWRVARWLMGWP